MDWLTFTSTLIGNIAWPIATLGIVLVLREPIKGLLALVSRVKVSAVEVEFDRKLEIAKEEASSNLPQPLTGSVNLDATVDSKLLKLAEASPRAAVMEAWRHVEAAALLAAKSLVREEKFKSKTMTFRAIQIIEAADIIPQSIVDLLRKLRSLRNDAAHAPEFSLTISSAIEYFELAAQVVGYLRNLTAMQRSEEQLKEASPRLSAAS